MRTVSESAESESGRDSESEWHRDCHPAVTVRVRLRVGGSLPIIIMMRSHGLALQVTQAARVTASLTLLSALAVPVSHARLFAPGAARAQLAHETNTGFRPVPTSDKPVPTGKPLIIARVPRCHCSFRLGSVQLLARTRCIRGGTEARQRIKDARFARRTRDRLELRRVGLRHEHHNSCLTT